MMSTSYNKENTSILISNFQCKEEVTIQKVCFYLYTNNSQQGKLVECSYLKSNPYRKMQNLKNTQQLSCDSPCTKKQYPNNKLWSLFLHRFH